MAVVKQHFTRSSGGLSGTVRVRRVGAYWLRRRRHPQRRTRPQRSELCLMLPVKEKDNVSQANRGASLFALWVVLQNKNATAKDEGHPQ